MNAMQQRAYADALGLSLWQPRFALPAAKASELVVVESAAPLALPNDVDSALMSSGAADAPASLNQVATATGSQAKELPSQLKQSLTASHRGTALAKSAPANDVVSAPAGQKAEPVVIDDELKIWPYGVSCVRVPATDEREAQLWLFELRDVAAPGLSQAEAQLLSNILLAQGVADPISCVNMQQTFNWPVVANPQLSRGKVAARDALRAYVSNQPHAVLRVFAGEQIVDWLSGIDFLSPCFSLSAMLQQPLLKKQCWQLLQSGR